MMARAAAWGLALATGLLLPTMLGLLAYVQGLDALLARPAPEVAMLCAALFLPPCLLLLVSAWLTQRAELAALGHALRRQAATLDDRRLATEALMQECRSQTALLQEQARLAIASLAAGQRQAEAVQALSGEIRLQQLVDEWRLVVAELNVTLAAMWRLAHGWKSPGPEARDLPLPPAEELPLHILRLLPATAKEMARFDVDERFVRQAARYRATYRAFLLQAPETGRLSRGVFADMIHGRLDARLALLPRPNHAEVIGPATLAAE